MPRLLRMLRRPDFQACFNTVVLLAISILLLVDIATRHMYGGWSNFINPRGMAGKVQRWIWSFPGMLNFSATPAPLPKSVSKWKKLVQWGSGLFAKKVIVEPARNPVATWILQSMQKVGVPHAAKIVDYISGHFFEILLVLFLLAIVFVFILAFIVVFRNQQIIAAKLSILKKKHLVLKERDIPQILARLRSLEASTALLIQQVERHAMQVAPVVINIKRQPSQARDLDMVCMATPFVAGYAPTRRTN